MVDKLLVNVKNTNANRYLVASFAITGGKAELKDMLKAKDPMIRDAALGILMNFEIEDLARIEIKERAKAMMITSFNNTLGGEFVDSIYFTEWAVQ
jgi:flagellar basal body-associated protein FliL